MDRKARKTWLMALLLLTSAVLMANAPFGRTSVTVHASISSSTSSGSPPKDWSQTYGGSSDEAANSVVQASDGGYALAGYTDSSGAGGDDFYLVKTDTAGASSPTAGINWNSILGYAIIAVIVVIIIGAVWSILARRGRRTDNPNISKI